MSTSYIHVPADQFCNMVFTTTVLLPWYKKVWYFFRLRKLQTMALYPTTRQIMLCTSDANLLLPYRDRK